MKTYYRLEVVYYVQIDTEKEMDAGKAGDYLREHFTVLPLFGHEGFTVWMKGHTITTRQLERIPKTFKEAEG